METHDHDSREDPWKATEAAWAGLRATLRDDYRDLVGDDGPSREQVTEALRTLGAAAAFLSESVGRALRDPDTRESLKTATSSFLTAVGRTLSDLGKEFASGDGE